MAAEGDVIEARSSFLKKRHTNLDFLLRCRYAWMNDYLQDHWNVVEIGAGAGFSEFYLKVRPTMTDVVKNPWIDRVLNATQMDMESQSVDCIIASHNIHHFASPYSFFKECERVLRPGGLILIQEINTSLLMRLMLRLMRHEGWSYEVNVFDEKTIVNDPRDPWSANCATPELLFEQTELFQRAFKNLRILLNKKNEGLIFPLSGGVIAKATTPELPVWILRTIKAMDEALISILPNVFALGRSVVLQKS
ncbi:MAG: class I SAM-dependent methyltransferase [Candidatus Omnitrophica bacterium]|nr:class I SAM-dependent methyltransferase [Candidatus Omnitrophota bacterium]